MSNQNFQGVHAVTVFCRDLESSAAFYRQFLGSESVFQTETSKVFKVGELLINLLAASAVPERIEPEVWTRSGPSTVFTVHVADLDSESVRLGMAGIGLLNGPLIRPWGIKALTVQDPDGQIWEVAQEL